MINDVVDLKNKNAKIVMDLIRFGNPLTKKEISEQSGLSITTVSTICSDLKTLGIISDEKSGNSRVGRIPIRIEFHYERFLVIGVDLQTDGTVGIAVTNLRNEMLFCHSYDISSLETAGEIAAFTREQFAAHAASCAPEDARYIGIGISVPAVYDATNACLVSSSIEKYEGVPMKALFSNSFNLPAYVDNSSNFKAISMRTTSKLDNIVCLDISQGTGVGIICNGGLLRGKNGYGGEVAHVPIGNPALRCPSCGAYGCIEAELQLEHLLSFYPDFVKSRPFYAQWTDFMDCIEKNRESFQPMLERIGYLLGCLGSILVNLFDPSLFMISGYIADLFPFLQDYFMEQIKQRCSLALSKGLTFQAENYHSGGIYEGICDTIYDEWSPLDKNSSRLCP